MKELISLEFFSELPRFWQVVFSFFTFIFGVFTFLLKNATFRKMMLNGIKKTFHYLNDKDVLMHPLFYNKKYYLNLLNNINFESKNKTELLRILLTEKITASLEMTYDWVSKVKLKELSQLQLRNQLFDLIMRIINTYEKNTREAFIKLHGRDVGLKLFGLIYESENGFKAHHQNRVLFISENIERVLLSQSKNKKDALRTILTQIDIAVDLAIVDCEEAFKALNGRIEDLINK